MSWNRMIHPELFQGRNKKKHYFEGWYYKIVSSDEQYSIAFIPGISINSSDPHSFLQLFISEKIGKDFDLKTYYFRYESSEFSFQDDPFFIRINNNQFSLSGIIVDLSDQGIILKGAFKLGKTTKIKTSLASPNIMGPFAYLKFMECYHGVISMNHQVDGEMLYIGKTIKFIESKGYIEKDWGKSFPKQYIWLQSNHFQEYGSSFMFSYASIPFLGFHFNGLIANLITQEKEYRFASYNFSKITILEILQNEVRLQIKKGKLRLLIHAKTENQISLKAPMNGLMINQIKEGLSGWIKIQLYEKEKLIYQDTGYHSGIEIMMELTKKKQAK